MSQPEQLSSTSDTASELAIVLAQLLSVQILAADYPNRAADLETARCRLADLIVAHATTDRPALGFYIYAYGDQEVVVTAYDSKLYLFIGQAAWDALDRSDFSPVDHQRTTLAGDEQWNNLIATLPVLLGHEDQGTFWRRLHNS